MGVRNRHKANRLYYVGLFALFGLVIAFCTSFLTYRLEVVSMQVKLAENAEDIFSHKVSTFQSFAKGLEDIVGALRDTSLLYSYLENPSPTNYDAVAACFQTIASSDSSLMQVRFIDEYGMEKIKAELDAGRAKPSLVPLNSLQDKKERYYFIEASQIPPGTFWYSKLDLNIENFKVEIPEKPVLRVASPVYLNQEFKGIVVINVYMREFLDKFLKNSVFDICMIDREGYYLVSHDPKKSWSRYRETGYSVALAYPETKRRILRNAGGELRKIDNIFVGSLAHMLTKDGAMLILHAAEGMLQRMREEVQKATVLIVSIIVLLSIPLALLISKGPTTLYKRISRQNRQLSESIDLVDKHIHRVTLDLEKTFVEVSSAFAVGFGVTKDTIIGRKYDTLYCSMRPEEYYAKVWDSLESEGRWEGEQQYIRSDGECYWADTVVLPRTDEAGALIGYSVIYQDVTDKKRIEELSITDEMTGLYNRRFYNVMIKKELGRAQREKHDLVFAMLDVDFFKQYNDNYGHQKGDVALQELATVMVGMLSRGSDYCFRLGGEEFGILLSSAEAKDSFAFVDSIRKAIEALGIEHKWSSVAAVVTVSIGMLTIKCGDPISVEKVYRITDKALYTAKDEGRNRVIARTFDVASEELVT
ncbi:MAG: hypothetical protein COA36_16165 [Desulfotalea sp.]|nr:MAG: hypothetical protein COA36_16165 [Desulfotalea sp.]